LWRKYLKSRKRKAVGALALKRKIKSTRFNLSARRKSTCFLFGGLSIYLLILLQAPGAKGTGKLIGTERSQMNNFFNQRAELRPQVLFSQPHDDSFQSATQRVCQAEEASKQRQNKHLRVSRQQMIVEHLIIKPHVPQHPHVALSLALGVHHILLLCDISAQFLSLHEHINKAKASVLSGRTGLLQSVTIFVLQHQSASAFDKEKRMWLLTLLLVCRQVFHGAVESILQVFGRFEVVLRLLRSTKSANR